MSIEGIKGVGIRAAYATSKSLNIDGLNAPATNKVAQTSFGEMLVDAAKSAVDTVRMGEIMSIQGLRGQADVQDVVQATMAAEASLQTMVSIRDKVVNAYQEVMRMAI